MTSGHAAKSAVDIVVMSVVGTILAQATCRVLTVKPPGFVSPVTPETPD